MKVVTFFCVIGIINAKHTNVKNTTKCNNVSVFGKNHKEEVLVNGINRPYQLSYHDFVQNYRSIEHIYFSYNTGFQNESTFEIAYVEVGWKVPHPIKGVKNGFATAINAKDNLIYFGGDPGIYMQSLSDPDQVVELDPKYDIWDMFYKSNLYFITKGRLHKHIAGNNSEIQEHVPERIIHFAIDGDEDMFITNKTGLYLIRNGTNHRIHVKGPKIFRAIEVNKEGVAHFCGQNMIYVVNKKEHRLVEVAKIKDIFGLAFDKDNHIIYSDPHQIVRLLPYDCKEKD